MLPFIRSGHVGFKLLPMVAAFAVAALVGCSSDDSGSGGAGEAGDDPGGKFGVIVNSRLQYQPATLFFNSSLESTASVTVTNVGTQKPVRITKISLKVDTTPHFSLVAPNPMELAPLGFTDIAVRFSPTEGNAAGTLVIEHDNPEQGPLQIPLLTSSQGGAVTVAPSLLQFGPIPVGSSENRAAFATASGTASIRIASAQIAGDHPDAFQVAASFAPVDIAATQSHAVNVEYLAPSVGYHNALLILQFEGIADENNRTVSIPLNGQAIASDLVADPAILDFGLVPLFDSAEIWFTLRNQGEVPVTVSSVLPTFGTHPDVSISSAPAWPLELAAKESAKVQLTFSPTEAFPFTMDPLGGIAVSTAEGGGSQFVLPVYGNVAAPKLVAIPTFVDFGLVAKDDLVTRDVILANQGLSPAKIEAVELIDDSNGEFQILSWIPATFGPGQSLQGGESVKLVLGFVNQQIGAITTGLVRVTSTDPEQPTIDIILEAKRGGPKACEVVLEPGALNFGIVPYGMTKTMPLAIRNVGTGPCTFQSATTFDCGSGIFGLLGQCQQGIGGQAKYFKVIGQPPPIPGGIPQGGKVTLSVAFMPPTDAPIFSFLDAFNGAIQVKVTDPSNGNAVISTPVGATAQDMKPNLFAQSGITEIGVIPSEIDFGLITLGCTSQETKLTIYNNGNAPLSITGIDLVDCTPEFSITQMPPIPPGGLEVNQGNPVPVWVLYKPQVPGKAFCTVAVTSSDTDQPLLTVPLQGEGTLDTDRTDTFLQTSGKDVDILFVVDDSGSMSEEQQNLANNFQSFIKEANTWGTNYQIGVVTTDMGASKKSGRLQGTPRYVVPGASAASQFQTNVKVGTNGSGDEKGLEAAYRALSLPLIRDTSVACTKAADCNAPDECVDGFCGGHNRGFLRTDATLEVVFVSDEEDSSPSQLTFYVDFLKSIKGYANENLMHAHAIVGDVPKGCSSSQGNADAGKRYVEVANATGGKVASICDASFAKALEEIGTVAFGLKTQFFLSAQAQPGTIKVNVGGGACLNGWTYEASSKSVIFQQNGPCMPQEGQTVIISYKILCLQEG